MNNELDININYKSILAILLLPYIASFSSINKYLCDDFKEKKKINYQLSEGEHLFEFENINFKLTIKSEGDPVGLYFASEKYKMIKLTSNNPEIGIEKKKEIFELLVKKAKEFNDPNTEEEIKCKILGMGGWKTISSLPKRKWNTIYLENEIKNNLYKDMEVFFKNEKKYQTFGIPYKRNYLLEGPPGTGKSSVIFSLASEFNLNIYIINLGPKVDDAVFMDAISSLPNKCILLLEDIDALFVDRKTNDSNKSMISFSGILNVLDGMGRKHGLITFMTTNYKNRLDSALIRPGRIDYVVKFDYITKEQLKEMFNQFIPNQINHFNEFYQKIKYKEITTAIIQKFFFELDDNNVIENIHKLEMIINDSNNKEKIKEGLYN